MQRIDRVLWMLRLTPTRGAAQALVGEGHVRVNGRRVVRCAQPVGAGDVVTMPHGHGVRVVRMLALPVRRGPAEEARRLYEEIESVSH
nr:S4 domain-containing protein [Croceicoccus bisphenolivorans]